MNNEQIPTPDSTAVRVALWRALHVKVDSPPHMFEDEVGVKLAARGVGQYVILGAGLDTFAQRRPEVASRLIVFEIDRPGAQEWKRQRLVELGLGVPSFLRLVPVDFESGDNWFERLAASGFDSRR